MIVIGLRDRQESRCSARKSGGRLHPNWRTDMKHQTLEKLQVVAKVDRDYSLHTMSRSERLERWAQLLERNPERRLKTLRETEYQPESVRTVLRADGSGDFGRLPRSCLARRRTEERQLWRSEAVFRIDRRAIARSDLLLPPGRDGKRRNSCSPRPRGSCRKTARHVRTHARGVCVVGMRLAS